MMIKTIDTLSKWWWGSSGRNARNFANIYGKYHSITSGSVTATLWPGASIAGAEKYTPISTFQTVYVSSSNNSDTGLLIANDSLDVNGRQYTPDIYPSATISGQTSVALNKGLLALNGAVIRTELPIVGKVYIHTAGTATTGGVPNDKTKILGIIEPGDNRTHQAHYTIPYNMRGAIAGGFVQFSSFSAAGKYVDVSWRGAEIKPDLSGWYQPQNIGDVRLDSALLPKDDLEYKTSEPLNPGTRVFIQSFRTDDLTAGVSCYMAIRLLKA